MSYSLFQPHFIYSNVILQSQISTGFDIDWRALFGKSSNKKVVITTESSNKKRQMEATSIN